MSNVKLLLQESGCGHPIDIARLQQLPDLECPAIEPGHCYQLEHDTNCLALAPGGGIGACDCSPAIYLAEVPTVSGATL